MSNTNPMPLQNQLQNQLFICGSKQGSNVGEPYRNYAGYDSGTVLCGGGSDVLFKNNANLTHNLMIGGVGLAPGTTLVKANNSHFEGVNSSLDEEECEIRPSQIDEFAEMRDQKKGGCDYGTGSGIGPAITSSYITIGDDDPFLTGRFCDASTKQFNFKPKANPSMPNDRKHQSKKL